jgi:hypothetical protein
VLVRIDPQCSKVAMVLCSMSEKSMEEIPVVCEFPHVIPRSLPSYPLTETWSL